MKSYIELCIDTTNTNDPKTTHPVVRIELPVACVSHSSVIENLIIPALTAAGFPRYMLEDYYKD